MLRAPKAVVEAKNKMTDEMKADQDRVKAMVFDAVNYTDEEANAAVIDFNQKAKNAGFEAISIATRDMIPAWQIKR